MFICVREYPKGSLYEDDQHKILRSPNADSSLFVSAFSSLLLGLVSTLICIEQGQGQVLLDQSRSICLYPELLKREYGQSSHSLSMIWELDCVFYELFYQRMAA